MAAVARKKKARGLGLAGRVVMLACTAAVLASVSQWFILPILMRNQVEAQRAQAVESALAVLGEVARVEIANHKDDDLHGVLKSFAAALPGGVATLYGPDGSVIAHAGAGRAIPFEKLPPALERVVKDDRMYVRAIPVLHNGKVMAYAAYSYTPRTLIAMMSRIVSRMLLILVLALSVIAPFFLPLARKVLKPVTDLERQIKARSESDRSKLADEADDVLLKPLLSAIDELHDRSEQAMRRALHLALADSLTGLPNRIRFTSRLETLVDRKATAVALMVCDVDRFRKLNLALGPRTSDRVLIEIAQRLRTLRSDMPDAELVLGRLSADQFGVLISGVSPIAAQRFAETICRAVGEPMSIDDQRLSVTASIGAACAPETATTASELMRQAEIALKEAKRGSGGKYEIFKPALMQKAHAQSELESEVRAGVERGEFIAVFQPKVRFDTGELVGAEALARWRRPDGKVVSPGVFVPIAEELGLISQLGESVLRHACRAAAQWNRDGARVSVAVNVSPLQFDDPDFGSFVNRALEETGLDPSLLELEITESAAVSDPERVARIMWPLRNRGVRLAIDDFGTGHSNFSTITRLPFSVFKIDQQFVRALATDSNAPAIIEMILAMAEALNLETVAEGVETREQADFLLRRACTIGQGYYFSPPLPAEEFVAFMRHNLRMAPRAA